MQENQTNNQIPNKPQKAKIEFNANVAILVIILYILLSLVKSNADFFVYTSESIDDFLSSKHPAYTCEYIESNDYFLFAGQSSNGNSISEIYYLDEDNEYTLFESNSYNLQQIKLEHNDVDWIYTINVESHNDNLIFWIDTEEGYQNLAINDDNKVWEYITQYPDGFYKNVQQNISGTIILKKLFAVYPIDGDNFILNFKIDGQYIGQITKDDILGNY